MTEMSTHSDQQTDHRATETAIAATAARGLTAGTTVMTLAGERRVEDLCPGDRIITRDTGMAVLRGVTARRLRTRAVAVAAGSLGHTRPDTDMVLPAGQRILIRDWRAAALYAAPSAMIPIARLIDGQYVRDLGEIELTIYDLGFDAAHVIYAGGMEVDAPLPAHA